ncbi:MAG: 5-formyltetrahydrofolate cyclo-ligase [Bacteroidales bacterium]|nr:5-formyltetrahydrofolate cyclo-ligase [Bacteroidales bacterium]
MESKNELRARMRALPCEKGGCGIWDRLETLDGFRDSDIVLLYWSIPGEPDTHAFIRHLAEDRKVALPVVCGDVLELRLYDAARMKEGYRGIAEPSAAAVTVHPDEIGFAVIPGLAFDASGRRLGRGKGFYDRLLPVLHCPVAGVCFDSHFVEKVPVDDYDMPVDLVITPNNLYLCKE